MNFAKKALLGLLALNLFVSTQLFSAKEEEKEEKTFSEKAYNFVVNKKTVAVVGLGIAATVAYKYGAFEQDAFLRNNKVSNYIAEATEPVRAKVGAAYDYLVTKTSPARKYVSEKTTSMTNYIVNKFNACSQWFSGFFKKSENDFGGSLDKLANFGKDYTNKSGKLDTLFDNLSVDFEALQNAKNLNDIYNQ